MRVNLNWSFMNSTKTETYSFIPLLIISNGLINDFFGYFFTVMGILGIICICRY